MFSYYFKNALSIILVIFYVDYCTLTRGQLRTIDQSAAGDGQVEYTNSTYQFAFESAHISTEGSSEPKSKRDTHFLTSCSEGQPKLVDGYYYKFNMPSNRSFLNQIDIVSVGYAFLLAFEISVLKKPHRYFDISDFLNKSGIHFPPTLPLLCYDTGYSLHESPLFNYGREDILRDLNAAEGSTRSQQSSGSSNIRLSATRHLNTWYRDSGYMVQRRKMYGELGNLLQNLRQGQKETLKTKCSQSSYTKPTALISDLVGTDTITVFSPNFLLVLEQFNEVSKMFIGDIVAYEMIRQACMAVGITAHSTRFPQITGDDWKPIADKLRAASYRIRNNWPGKQLREDIQNSDLDRNEPIYSRVSPVNIHSSLESLFQGRHSDALMKKYYQYGFRVSARAEWIENWWDGGRALLQEICNARHDQICIWKRYDLPRSISSKCFVVKWQSLRPSELSSLYEAPQQYVKFPKVTPPPSSYKFTALYAKVHKALEKVQNAANYVRVNEMEKRHYKNVNKLVEPFDQSAGYDIFTETAGHFAKTLDVLNVFRQELLPLINTLSEAAMHAREEGIEKVWLLIDRSFNEMDCYMADIEQHITQMRQKFKETYAYIFSSSTEDTNAQEFFFGDRPFEEIKTIRKAFKKYLCWARFYPARGKLQETPVMLKEFIDKCGSVKSAIDTLPVGGKASLLVPELIIRAGSWQAFYVQMFLLAPLYDITYLTLYTMICACQRYRWVAESDPVGSTATMGSTDIQQFIRNAQLDVSDTSVKLDELIEDITTYVYKGKFDWIDYLWNAISSEAELPELQQDATDANAERIANNMKVNAERIANKLKVLFPWNNFTLDLIKPFSPNYVIQDRNEKIYYYRFWWDPDYSMVAVQPNNKLTVIVNWVPVKTDSGLRPSGEDFGFYSGSNRLCQLDTDKIKSNLVNYQNIKSVFIWRTNIGWGRHLSKLHGILHDLSLSDFTDFRRLSSATYNGGHGQGIKRSWRTCWYRHSSIVGTCTRNIKCHMDDQIALYALGNFGGDY